ncbi:hypothetical protein D3C72_1389580 [compost metagenome]
MRNRNQVERIEATRFHPLAQRGGLRIGRHRERHLGDHHRGAGLTRKIQAFAERVEPEQHRTLAGSHAAQVFVDHARLRHLALHQHLLALGGRHQARHLFHLPARGEQHHRALRPIQFLADVARYFTRMAFAVIGRDRERRHDQLGLVGQVERGGQ